MSCQRASDTSFWPDRGDCLTYRDLTLLFEQTILSIGPSSIFLIASLFRACVLLRRDTKVSYGALAASQTALLALWLVHRQAGTPAAAPAAALGLAAAIAASGLSALERSRSVRPSTIIVVYLALSSLLDIVQTRTLWLRGTVPTIAIVFTLNLVFKLILFSLETRNKQKHLKMPYREWPPESLASVVSRTLFWWLNVLMIRGYRTVLGIGDLFPVDSELSSHYLARKAHDAWASRVLVGKYSLMSTIMWCFRSSFSMIIFPRLLMTGFKFAQPFLLRRVVALLGEPESQTRTEAGRLLIAATALVYVGLAFTNAHFRHHIYRSMTMVRGALVAMIFDVSLKLSASALEKSTAVTLMSTDIDRIVYGLEDFDNLFAAPIEIGLAIYLLYRDLGLASLIPVIIAIYLVSTVGAFVIGKVTSRAQKTWIEAVDNRVATTLSAFKSAKAVKMTGVSDAVSALLHNFRRVELDRSKSYRKATTARNAISNFSLIAAPSLTFLAYVFISRATTGISFEPDVAFASLSLISLLSSAIQYWAWAIPAFVASLGSYSRIQDYLLLAEGSAPRQPAIYVEKSDRDAFGSMPEGKPRASSDLLVTIDNASFGYGASLQNVLQDISLQIRAGTVHFLSGSVQSGKSTLLRAMLREVLPRRGHLRCDVSSIAYCAQHPWVPNTSVRDVITATSTLFDQVWFSAVMHACGLDEDCRVLPQGIQTRVGTNGANLSGGQQQRLALARALYSRPRLLLLDDVTSGLDRRTETIVFRRVLGPSGICRTHGIAVVCVTHATQHLGLGDHVWYLNDGKLTKPDFLASLETESDGIRQDTLSHVSPSSETTSGHEIYGNPESSSIPEHEATEDITRQKGDWKVYTYYFQAFGVPFSIAFLTSLAIVAFGIKFPTVWLQWWSEAEAAAPGTRTVYYASIMTAYAGIGLVGLFVSVGLLFIVMVPKAGAIFHQKLLAVVLNAPYYFMSMTDVGTTVNRFSQDLSLIDVQLPGALLQTVDGAYLCIFEAALIISSNKYLTITIPFILGVLYLIQRFYLRNSRQIRLMDIEAKAPMYTAFLEMLSGVETIRAFGWQTHYTEQTFRLLDMSQRPFYLLYCIQRWLNLVLDLFIAALAVLVVALATQVPNALPGALGVALTNVTSFSTSLAYLVQAWAQLETSIGAIARVKTFVSSTPSEKQGDRKQLPPRDWPSEGSIIFDNFTGLYRQPVLRNINLQIQPGEKVAIVGRTGSGKSSLLLSILQMLSVVQGSVTIDGLSLGDIPADTARKALVTMPQAPYTQSLSSVRFNLDPEGSLTDDVLRAALRKVQLEAAVGSCGGLDAAFKSLDLTPGQTRLFSLARTILSGQARGNKGGVVLLDEITAGVDADLEVRMVEAVQEAFANFTVVAVAHRIAAIRDFDRVVVMNTGQIEEVGRIDDLAADPQSAFARLLASSYSQNGAGEAQAEETS
ncbi:P-loop containing nucleoside triphosphate hydrolase protein [Nemania serpens]|nr:P-loop containing nucleoside triphosphate hydrolase protein [Nemania serpens]